MAGCGGGEAPASDTPVTPTASTPTAGAALAKLDIGAEAGVPVEMPNDPGFQQIYTLAATRNYGHRNDPFALQPIEKAFDADQSQARTVEELGGFTLMYVPPEEKPDEQEISEPQPANRRLAGIVLAKSGVYALLEWDNGRVYEIRPGTRIEGTEWVVVSVDDEKAVLRRGGNRLPHEIVIPLRGSLGGEFGGGGGGGNNGGGGGGGAAGAPSGGKRGGRGAPSGPQGPGQAPGLGE